jgi:hypothetical protein
VGRLDDSAPRAEMMDQHALLLLIFLVVAVFVLAFRS